MGSEESQKRRLHCGGCGCEEYHLNWTMDGEELWAECADCGRPTSVIGAGRQKQRAWERQNE